MKLLIQAAGAASLMALAAYGSNADDKAADTIAAMAENRADALEDAADAAPNETMEDALEAQADNVEDQFRNGM